MGRVFLRPDRSPVSKRSPRGHAWAVEMFLIGFAAGAAVLAAGELRPASDRRRRDLTTAEALGYRAALGEDPAELPIREPRPTGR